MDEVFKALADPTRRGLLDQLFKQDGQTLSALEAQVDMTRFGVMKHLAVLEGAGLVTTQRRGREKLHFLNTVPIRLAHDRWVSKYAEPWAATLSRLKTHLEDDMTQTVKTVSWAEGTAPVAAGTAVFEVFIKTTPERLWQAITDPVKRGKYSFGIETHSDWSPGSTYRAGVPGVVDIASGENIEVDPPRLLVQTFDALWSDDVKAQGTTRVTWEIEPVGSSCRLTVTHDQLPADANAELYGGWPMILSGLKTLLETGELLDTPGSLRYAPARRNVRAMPDSDPRADVCRTAPDLDHWLPDPTMRVAHRRESDAPAERLWQAAQTISLSDTRLLGRLIRWRIPGLPPSLAFDDMFRSRPFMVLWEADRTALIAGLVGRIWTLRRDYPELSDPEEFREWSAPGTARVLFANWMEPASSERTAIRAEVRVEAIGTQGRVGVAAVRPLVGAFGYLIGSDGIELAVRRAERG